MYIYICNTIYRYTYHCLIHANLRIPPPQCHPPRKLGFINGLLTTMTMILLIWPYFLGGGGMGGVSFDSHDWSDFEIHFSLEIIVQHSKNAKIQPQSCSAVNLRVWNGQGLSRAILRVCSGIMICHCAWCIPWTYSQVQAVWRNFWARISIEISSCSPPSWDCCLYMSITPCHLSFLFWTEEVHWAPPPCCGTHFMIWVIQFYQTLANLCPNAI